MLTLRLDDIDFDLVMLAHAKRQRAEMLVNTFLGRLAAKAGITNPDDYKLNLETKSFEPKFLTNESGIEGNGNGDSNLGNGIGEDNR